MKIRLVVKITGFVLMIDAAVMILPLIVALIYRERDWHTFLVSIMATAAAGALMYVFTRNNKNRSIQARDGFAIVALSWLLLSVFGSIPYMLSGAIPSFGDAMFESISGFTTTGATVIRDVEILSRSILFWRSLTNWVGGMGVLILFLALLPSLGERSIQLLRAESPGPSPSKLVPKIGETAKILYFIYIALTVLQAAALLIAGMPLYDSIVHSLSTAGTGGFSIRNASIGAYGNPAFEVIIGVFMVMFGVNFAIYYHLIRRQYGKAAGNSELRAYAGVILATVVLISINIRPLYDKLGQAINHAFFQTASILSSTGFSTADYSRWPDFAQILLVALMVSGACAGSTTGGVKMVRIVILFKAVKQEIKSIIYPRAVNLVRMDGKAVGDDVIAGCLKFFAAYVVVLAGSTIVLSLDNFGFTTSFTASLSCLSNIGPGLDAVGPMGSYADFSVLSKTVLSFVMLVGRLEIFPFLVLLAPSAWRKA